MTTPSTVDRQRLRSLMDREEARFVAEHPRSAELFERGRRSLLAGVPMPWMSEWAGPYPVFVAEAEGAHFTDVDGHEYVDLCLGDTGAMTGHSPKEAVRAIAEQASRGITLMLPTEDSIWVGEEMARRFGLPYWQFCLTATDANRFTIRLARAITGRPKILVYSWCYHGSVDETIAVVQDGVTVPRPGNIGPPVHPSETTRVVEWNDPEALERELAHEDVACVLAEPALTNIGIVPPDPGYHETLRALTRRHETYLVIDETHCICAGPGGATRAWGLDPDFLTIGKPLASGVPAACYGMSAEVGERVQAFMETLPTTDVGGVGGTLSGNALSLAAMRATLEHVLTEEAFERMIALGERWATGVKDAIERHGLPWTIQRIGARAEYWFCPTPPRTGGEAAAADDHELARFTHLYALNRGVLLTPFHNMALMSPATTAEDVDRHSAVFEEMAAELTG
ncbi:MAG TPA: aspartate aminotransferase family protein [Actinomycetota bacterium]|nr:aspartate aminotransferase family protein [Actinomycetota bacterium]